MNDHGARDAVFLSEDGHELTAVTDQGVVDAAHGETVDVSAQTGEVWLFAPDGSRLL